MTREINWIFGHYHRKRMIYGIWSWVHALERDTNTGQWHNNISLREHVVFLQRAIYVSIYCVQCIINIMESAYGVTSSLSHQKNLRSYDSFFLCVFVCLFLPALEPPHFLSNVMWCRNLIGIWRETQYSHKVSRNVIRRIERKCWRQIKMNVRHR